MAPIQAILPKKRKNVLKLTLKYATELEVYDIPKFELGDL